MNNNVKVIKASVAPRDKRKINQLGELRVGAYCRVSTDTEDQLNSYNSQVKYYTDLINSKQEWTLVDIYADEGITGTQVGKRENFQRMINDCAEGKIDMIITKSISRFARNTVDTLQFVRKLKERNIAVFFEEENINTLSMDGELLLTILSSVAQQEVENISANVKKGLKMKMQRGEMIGFKGCLGYDYDPVTKNLVINEKEAEVVRFIFTKYLEGNGSFRIAKLLKEKGYTSKGGCKNWPVSTIITILKNEKYKGDLLLGKSFTSDPINKKKIINNGEEDKYYISNHHEPIISAETFDRAQEIMNKNSESFKKSLKSDGFRPSKYAFSQMLECGFCGHKLQRRGTNEKCHNNLVGWNCTTAVYKGRKACEESRFVDERVIESGFLEVLNCLKNSQILDDFLYTLKTLLNDKSPERKADDLLKEIKNLENKKAQLLDIRMEGILTKEDFEIQYTSLNEKMDAIKEQLSKIDEEISQKELLAIRIEDLRKVLSIKTIDRFDRETFELLVEKVIVGGYDEQGKPDPYLLEYKFKVDYNYKINGQAIKKKYTVCQNESNDIANLTTYCHLHSTQVRRYFELRSTDTFSEIYRSSEKRIYFLFL